MYTIIFVILSIVNLPSSFWYRPVDIVVPDNPVIEVGLLSQYEEQPSIDTLWYRQHVSQQIPLDVPENAVFMAVADCDQIGRQGLISIDGNEWEPLYIYDCAGSQHAYNWLVDNGFLGEIDFWAADRHDVICRCPVDGRVIWLD